MVAASADLAFEREQAEQAERQARLEAAVHEYKRRQELLEALDVLCIDEHDIDDLSEIDAEPLPEPPATKRPKRPTIVTDDQGWSHYTTTTP